MRRRKRERLTKRLAIVLALALLVALRSFCRTYGVCIPAMKFHTKGSGVLSRV